MNAQDLKDRHAAFDAAWKDYDEAAKGLTYAEVDEAERRTRIARFRLTPYLDNVDASKLDASAARWFSVVREQVRVGEQRSRLGLVGFLGSVGGNALWSAVHWQISILAIVISVFFGVMYLLVQWEHEKMLGTKF